MLSTSVLLTEELVDKIKANHLNASALIRALLEDYFHQRQGQHVSDDLRRVVDRPSD